MVAVPLRHTKYCGFFPVKHRVCEAWWEWPSLVLKDISKNARHQGKTKMPVSRQNTYTLALSTLCTACICTRLKFAKILQISIEHRLLAHKRSGLLPPQNSATFRAAVPWKERLEPNIWWLLGIMFNVCSMVMPLRWLCQICVGNQTFLAGTRNMEHAPMHA